MLLCFPLFFYICWEHLKIVVITNLLGVSIVLNVQEAAALAATEVAFILQSGQGRGVHFTIAPDSPATPQHEPQP
jgi:hypothetical protein